jgi:lauroyl/myristoyl acyltransferase
VRFNRASAVARPDVRRGPLARLRDAGVELVYSLGWALVRKLPRPIAFGLLQLLADLAWMCRVRGVLQLQRNLRRVRPEASDEELWSLTRAGMRSYFRYWCEMFRLPDMTREEIDRKVVTHNEEIFWAAVESGRGIVAALPHMGNWDFAGAWATSRGIPMTAVAERLRPERLFDRFVAHRAALGIEVLPVTGGPDPMTALTERLAAGRVIGLVADRDLSARGVDVTFLGEPTRMPAGPAALAVRTGATLLPVTMWYDGPSMHIRFHEPLERTGGQRQAIRELTQRLADVFAQAILEHPEDWHMLQPLWLADLRPSHRASIERQQQRRRATG